MDQLLMSAEQELMLALDYHHGSMSQVEINDLVLALYCRQGSMSG
jgi:hypothetical protein